MATLLTGHVKWQWLGASELVIAGVASGCAHAARQLGLVPRVVDADADGTHYQLLGTMYLSMYIMYIFICKSYKN